MSDWRKLKALLSGEPEDPLEPDQLDRVPEDPELRASFNEPTDALNTHRIPGYGEPKQYRTKPRQEAPERPQIDNPGKQSPADLALASLAGVPDLESSGQPSPDPGFPTLEETEASAPAPKRDPNQRLLSSNRLDSVRQESGFPGGPPQFPADPPDTRESAFKWLGKTRLADQRNAAGFPGADPTGPQFPADPPRGRSPATDSARSLVARAGARGAPAELNPNLSVADIEGVGGPGLGPDPAQEAVAARQPLRPQEGGGQPSGPTPPMAESGEGQDTTEGSLLYAQRQRQNLNREAAYYRGMGQAADGIAQGKSSGDHGAQYEQRGEQGVQDVLAREAEGQRQLNEGRATEDQGFQRAGEQRAQGADADRKTTFGNQQKTFADQQEADAPGTPRSLRLENATRALYRNQTKEIPKGELSENQWKTVLSELQQQKAGGSKSAGGGLGAGKGVAALSKLLPLETANIHAGMQRIKQLVEKGGGWEKVGGVGLAGGKMSTWMPEELGGLNDNESALRSEIGGMAGTYLQSKGGKAITASEDKIILGKIAANPNSATPQQLQQAMGIIERYTAGNARQGLAVLPEEMRSMILENAGVPRDWVYQDQQAPTRQPEQKPQRFMVNPKTGQRVPITD